MSCCTAESIWFHLNREARSFPQNKCEPRYLKKRGKSISESWSSKCKGPVIRLSKVHWGCWKKATLTEVQRAEWGISLWVDIKEVILGQTRHETIEHIRKISFYLKSNSKLSNSLKRGSSMINIPLEIKYSGEGLEKRADRKVSFTPSITLISFWSRLWSPHR